MGTGRVIRMNSLDESQIEHYLIILEKIVRQPEGMAYQSDQFEAHLPELSKAIEWCYINRRWKWVLDFASVLRLYIDFNPSSSEGEKWMLWGLEAIRQIGGNELLESQLRLSLGDWYLLNHDYESSEAQLRLSLKISENLNSQWLAGRAMSKLAVVLHRQSRTEEAIEVGQTGVELLQPLGKHPIVESLWYNLGIMYRDSQRWPEAVNAFETSLAVAYPPMDLREMEKRFNLGLTQVQLSDLVTARQQFEKVIRLGHSRIKSNSPSLLLESLVSAYCELAKIARSEGNYSEASTLIEQALGYALDARRGDLVAELKELLELLEGSQ
jgi:tetratricopeptide (TPR) repeat protein